MSLTVVLSSRISPDAPMSTILVRSPFATALVTAAISRTWGKGENGVSATRGHGPNESACLVC